MSFTTLVDHATLADHLHDPDWVIIDCRFALTDPNAGRRLYEIGHPPGARYAHLNDDLSAPVTPQSGRHPLPDPSRLAETLGAWGAGDGTQVVVYDDSFGAMAARLWWLLRWLGHMHVALLDGGLPKWTREGRLLTPAAPVVQARRFTPRIDDSQWVDADFVQRAVGAGSHVLIDARAEERFRGEVEPLDPVAGHIPGAVNRPFEDNLDHGGCFQDPAGLREDYRSVLGEAPPENVIAMCGSGVTACHNILAMEHAGLSGAKLYAGSWSEWIRDARRPVTTGD